MSINPWAQCETDASHLGSHDLFRKAPLRIAPRPQSEVVVWMVVTQNIPHFVIEKGSAANSAPLGSE